MLHLPVLLLFFVDEPTTGLDARHALRMMKALSKLSSKCTVICTIHQPRSTIFHLFSSLLILDGGRVAFHGPTTDAIPTFSKAGFCCPTFVNPADFFLDVLEEIDEESRAVNEKADRGSQLRAGFAEHQEKSDLEDPNEPDPVTRVQLACRGTASHQWFMDEIYQMEQLLGTASTAITSVSQPRFRTSGCSRYCVLGRRTWVATLRNYSVTLMRTGRGVAIALLVGVIFFQLPDDSKNAGNRIRVLLFLMCVFSLFCLPAITFFIADRLMFTRERAAGYHSTAPYFLAISTVEFPVLLAVVLLYGSICYWMLGFEAVASKFWQLRKRRNILSTSRKFGPQV